MNHNFESLEERQLSTTEYFSNSFLRVVEDEVVLPNQKVTKRAVVHHPGGVNLIALDQKKRLILVEQFRYSVGMALIETPAGKSEPGEDNRVTAARELEEETGFRAKTLKSIGRFATTPGFTSEFIENFLATDLEAVTDGLKGDDDEFLNLFFLTKEEAWQWVESGKIVDFKTVYGIQYLTLNNLW